MKVDTRIKFEFEIKDGYTHGSYDPHMGHGTYLCINSIKQKDEECGNLTSRIPNKGDNIEFEIPSGKFVGTVFMSVMMKEQGQQWVYVDGEWNGIYGGLMGGMSCYGVFSASIDYDAVVESSWGTMMYSDYKLIRALLSSDHAHSVYEKFMEIELDRIQDEYSGYIDYL